MVYESEGRILGCAVNPSRRPVACEPLEGRLSTRTESEAEFIGVARKDLYCLHSGGGIWLREKVSVVLNSTTSIVNGNNKGGQLLKRCCKK